MIIESAILPLGRANVDTDQIIPASKLTGIAKTGLGVSLFSGMPGGPELLAQHPQAQVVVAGENFGCGSSREHAVWALTDRGFRAVIAPSFARIFHENAYANGLVPIVLAPTEVEAVLAARSVRIDVEAQHLEDDAGRSIRFELDPLRKRFLLEGGFLEFLAARIPSIRAWELAQRSTVVPLSNRNAIYGHLEKFSRCPFMKAAGDNHRRLSFVVLFDGRASQKFDEGSRGKRDY